MAQASQNVSLTAPGIGDVEVYSVENLVVGSGAAGLNCAEHLADAGREVVVLTSKLRGGTSRNSGSDKQTYYKLGIFGDVNDCPMDMARALFQGGMMHGDHAYIEALYSVPEFFHLVRNGVPFPCNRYGAYVGYKTDHDPRQRATSAGPETSAFMVEGFLKRLEMLRVPIYDHRRVVRLLLCGDAVCGVVALNRKKCAEGRAGLEVFLASSVVLATGGPGQLFRYSVFPPGQVGGLAVALRAGAAAGNLTEWQFGIASTKFRWNLSGSYQQVIPCYWSVDKEGDKHFFLNEIFSDMREQASRIFLKGYQWPFHAPYLCGFGSSLVDLAVSEELAAGREVFLDFRMNPAGTPETGFFDLADLEPEARTYLERSEALGELPIERLEAMNPDAAELYRKHGIDPAKDPLACAVCAQHINGGLSVNDWWETTCKNLYAIGEVAGTHGVRPGGSALNAGQTGGARAAEKIVHAARKEAPALSAVKQTVLAVLNELAVMIRNCREGKGGNPSVAKKMIQKRMTAAAGFLRREDRVGEALREAVQLRKQIAETGLSVQTDAELCTAFEAEELALVSEAVLKSLEWLFENGGGSRGSYVVVSEKGRREAVSKKGVHFRFEEENRELRKTIGEVRRTSDGSFTAHAMPVRPLPNDTSWYETEWKRFKQGKGIE